MPSRKRAVGATAAETATTTTATTRNTPSHKRSHKRELSTPSASVGTITPGTRTSKRVKATNSSTPNGKVTAKKSKYFDGADSDLDDDDVKGEEAKEEATVSSAEDVSESGYEDEDASATEPSEPPTETDEYDSEEDDRRTQKKKRVTKKGGGGTRQVISEHTSGAVDRQDLWKEGVKTGLGPGKQVFIAKPKPKGDGGIKYVPGRIHPHTMEFLADLRKNNDREWLKMYDPDYRQSWKDWTSFVEALTEKISEVDETVPELPPKDLVFRIYRDVRFSKDPTPYKDHFSAAWSRTGRKGPFAAYYLQIKPGGSFIGSGLWCPAAEPLALLRRSIDRHPERIKSVLVDAGIRKRIFGGISNDPKKAVKAFANQNTENALKSKPKGFEATHPNIELLRLRNFTIGTKLTDDIVNGANFIDKVTEIIQTMLPFVTFLNSVVMPDDDEEDESDEDQSHDDDHGNGDEDDEDGDNLSSDPDG